MNVIDTEYKHAYVRILHFAAVAFFHLQVGFHCYAINLKIIYMYTY